MAFSVVPLIPTLYGPTYSGHPLPRLQKPRVRSLLPPTTIHLPGGFYPSVPSRSCGRVSVSFETAPRPCGCQPLCGPAQRPRLRPGGRHPRGARAGAPPSPTSRATSCSRPGVGCGPGLSTRAASGLSTEPSGRRNTRSCRTPAILLRQLDRPRATGAGQGADFCYRFHHR